MSRLSLSTRRTVLVVGASLALIAVSAAPAYASRVSESGGSVEYDAGSGEFNRVQVNLAVAGSGRTTVTITDSENISTSGSCSYPDGGNRRTVSCNAGRNDARADIDLGDRDDILRVVQQDPGQAPEVRISDGAGDDVITVNNGTTTWANGPGADIYRGGAGRDVTLPGDGDDFILGGYGNDQLIDDNGNDQISGNVGNDRIEAGDGFDLVEGNAGDDTISGGSDGDFVFGGGGNDRLDGNAGFDRLFGGPGSDVVDGSRSEDNRSG